MTTIRRWSLLTPHQTRIIPIRLPENDTSNMVLEDVPVDDDNDERDREEPLSLG